MNERQQSEWTSIVNSCLSPDLASIDVGSLVRRDVIITISCELVLLRQQRDALLEACKRLVKATEDSTWNYARTHEVKDAHTVISSVEDFNGQEQEQRQ